MSGRDPMASDEERSLGRERAHFLSNLTQRFILRRTQTINDRYLPEKVDLTVFCHLGKVQQQVYRRITELAFSELASTPLVAITALKKLCNHLDLLAGLVRDKGNAASTLASVLPPQYKTGSLASSMGSKVAFVSAVIDALPVGANRDKLVIVSNYTQTLDILAELLRKRHVSFFQLDGNTPIKQRQELVDRFNAPSAPELVFLLSSKAGGVGLNLVGANRLILFDPDWNPANDAQAMGRVWRDGQKKKVFIYRLLSTGSIEEKIYQRQVSKQGLSANVVDMEEGSTQHFTSDDLRALFAYRPDTDCDTHDLLGCSCQRPRLDVASAVPRKFRKVAQNTGPRMDELKSWQHIRDFASTSIDTVLHAVVSKHPELVSFVFASERVATKIEEMQIDRTFSEDEKGVVTCSQAEDAAIVIHAPQLSDFEE